MPLCQDLLDAKHYKTNSSVQKSLSQQSLALHSFKGTEHVLDIGCRDGKVSMEIAKQVPLGKVHAIDFSPDMISLAQQDYQAENLCFAVQDVLALDDQEKYDLITGFCSLHWMNQPKQALEHIHQALVPYGRLLLLTFPLESAYWQLFARALDLPRWQEFRKVSALNTMLSQASIDQVIQELNYQPLVRHVVQKEAQYLSFDAFIAYAKGWLSLLAPIPCELQDAFLQDVLRDIDTSSSFSLPYTLTTLYLEKSI